jgi:hypothetical protein
VESKVSKLGQRWYLLSVKLSQWSVLSISFLSQPR